MGYHPSSSRYRPSSYRGGGSSSSTSSSSSSSSCNGVNCQVPIGAIIGAVVGGCVALIIVVGIYIYRRNSAREDKRRAGNVASNNKNDLDKLEMASQSQPLVSHANGMGHSRGNASISNSHLEGSEIVYEAEVSHYKPPTDPNHTPDHEQVETVVPEVKIIPSAPPHPTSGRQSQANNDDYDDDWDHSTVRVQALSYSGNKERYSSESSREREDFEY